MIYSLGAEDLGPGRQFMMYGYKPESPSIIRVLGINYDKLATCK